MTIDVTGRKQALRMAEQLREDTAFISITSPEEPDVVFPDDPHIRGIFRIRCTDLTGETDEEGIPYGRPLPKEEDFFGLKTFVDALFCARLIVHCHEGTSRSPAVARAVYEYRGCRDTLRMGDSAGENRLVYALVCRELGI